MTFLFYIENEQLDSKQAKMYIIDQLKNGQNIELCETGPFPPVYNSEDVEKLWDELNNSNTV